jgi:hypothetical protein
MWAMRLAALALKLTLGVSGDAPVGFISLCSIGSSYHNARHATGRHGTPVM